MAYKQNSYLKFVATAATATLVVGAVAPLASAASFTDVSGKYKEAVDFVVSKGANGFSETSFGVSQDIKRVDAAVLLVKVLDLDIEAAPASGFTDVPNRAVKYVNALKAAGITNGKSATKFDADSKITRGELAIWIQKGFELKGDGTTGFTDVSDRYKQAVSALVTNKITSGTTPTQFGTDSHAKRGDYAMFLYKAANMNPEVAEVTGVNAINAKEIEVKFGAEVNIDAAKFTVTEGTKDVPVTKKLSDDKKSVILTVSPLTNKAVYVVTVEDVKTVTGKDVAKAVELLLFNDEVNPTVSSISTPKGTLKVTFSEKLDETKDVKVVVNGAELTKKPVGNSVTFTKSELTALNLETGKSFSVIVDGASDLVGNSMALYQGNAVYSVEKDVTAPIVSEVKFDTLTVNESDSKATIQVNFSEELSNAGSVVVKKGTKTLDATISLDSTDKTKATIVVEKALEGSETTADLSVEFVGYKDLENNVGEKSVKTVTVSKDVVASNFVKATTKDLTATLEFDKKAASTVAGNLRVIDVTSSKIVTPEKITVNNGKVEVKFAKAGTYKLIAQEGFVLDAASNKSTAFSTEVTVNEGEVVGTVKPSLVGAPVYDVAKNTITLTFSKEVKGGTGSTSATNTANYKVAGGSLPQGTLITLDTTEKVATIELPSTFKFEKDETVVFTAANVESTDHVKMNSADVLFAVQDTKTPEFTAAKIVGNNIVLTFSEAIGTFDTADFAIDLNGVELTATKADDQKVDGKVNANQVVVTVSNNDVSLATGTITVKPKTTANYTNKTTDASANKNVLSVFNAVQATR
ncbi:S-layer homology domain-containing protein [Peribacillus sp. NPDC096379]|uniref:S-layer homology domain-containing protein n=1 Tax=Peribacillus sp. NPDC096379 TaxID=3364393 RepID=UPI003828147E